MRIGTISFPAIDNYGAVLQAQALVGLLEREGYEANIIDYQLRGLKFFNRLHTMHLSYMRHAPWPVLSTVPELFARFSVIEQFRRRYLSRTRSVWRDDELQEVARYYNAIITGSDEVFRVDHKGEIFSPLFLDFADPSRQKLLAYAACAGEVSDYGVKNDAVAKLLNRFHGISVRDEATRTLVKKLTGKDSPVVLDPTLLWSFDELPLPEPPEKNYLLVYGYFRSPQTDRMVRETADKCGLKMISVGWASKYAHRNLMAADTLQWLSCLKHARLVFTNCYHGLMFSTLYQRDFLVFESGQARSKLHDFINRFSLASRLLPGGFTPSAEQLAGMDHAALQQKLKPYARDSIHFLQAAIVSGAGPAGRKDAGYELDRRPQNEALEDLPAWRDFVARLSVAEPDAWPVLSAALAGKTFHAARPQLQPVWESEPGHVPDIPGWEWFHFVVPTAIRAKRRSVERVAAEVEQLLYSDHFQQYAIETGISGYVRPLLLAYLLHLKQAVPPSSGRTMVADLFDFLRACWWLAPAAPTGATPGKTPWGRLRFQFRSAAVQLANLFWEPSLALKAPPSLGVLFKRDWPIILPASLFIILVGAVQYLSKPNLVFLPFYLLPCVLLTWKVDRRWGMLAACVGAAAGPLIRLAQHAGPPKLDVVAWNIVMRLLILQMCVRFTEQIRRRKKFSRHPILLDSRSARFAENWPLVLASSLFFLAVTAVDFLSNPQMIFLPLYLLPCMILTLAFNRFWGLASALVAVSVASLVEYATNPDYKLEDCLGWNLIMRLTIAVVVIYLLDCIRQENIMFFYPNRK